jgi:uncharacterized C2H2 Zn-finger protein
MPALSKSAAQRLPLNCPACGLRLDYVRWENGTHFYRCPRHGAVVLTPDGRVREDDPENSFVVH